MNLKMKSHRELSDELFEIHFREGNFSPELFTHEAHLRLSWIHIRKYGLQQAEVNVVTQLRDFVQKVGAADKFHLTLTIAALQVMHHFIKKAPKTTFTDLLERHPVLVNDFKSLIEAHYSKEILASSDAKNQYLMPDLLNFNSQSVS